jgi:LacI family transcriptional regulator, galactose operon repressor
VSRQPTLIGGDGTGGAAPPAPASTRPPSSTSAPASTNGPRATSARPTLRDVAARAHVSFKTVSRVVNNEPRVRPETADRVQQAIRDLGFSRNYNARSLRRGVSSATIGLVIGDVANPFFAAMARAVEEVARTRGHLLVTASTDEDVDRERNVIAALIERRVRGIVVVPVGHDHRYLEPETRLGTAIVFLDRPPGRIEADRVLLDNVGGARLGVEHLIAHGHRRIGILVDRLDVFTLAERYQGYRQALEAAGLPLDETLVRFGCHTTDAAARAVRDLLELADPPTAIFTTNNRMSIGAVEVLAEMPEPVALVGFDDFELAAAVRLPVTVVSYDQEALGRTAGRLLFDRLDGDRREPQAVTLPTRLIERGSGELRPPGVPMGYAASTRGE